MNTPDIKNELDRRILILDGAMGTMIQTLVPMSRNQGSMSPDGKPYDGNNDVLNLWSPELIGTIHQEYIHAGADIITTNTFSANRISQQEYGLAERAAEMARAGARIARQAADSCLDRKIWVAGSMGPTSKTLSLATDLQRPLERAVDFDTLADAYYEQARALVEGGADLLLLETCFDALNAKAALYAIGRLDDEREQRVPVMVSATINDRSGRTLTGQTLDAFYTSIAHYPILSFGLNCAFGVTELRPFVEQLARHIPVYLSLYPNAGLPNEMGEYDEQPAFTVSHLREMAADGLLNLVGGCCGTTPQHIRAIANAVSGLAPRRRPTDDDPSTLHVAGLVAYDIADSQSGKGDNRMLTYVGERTNVAGSRKFARLIAEKKYDEAALVARHQIEGGAPVIDINMDDAMLDSRAEMRHFLRYISNDPAVATATLMIDSSDWPTVVEGLKNAQGKCIVNSISLKEGEDAFLKKARELRRFGAAVVVMAFDEQGQATTYERKTAIAARAYELLTAIGFPPQDIIFDVNILSVGTGIEEHASYGIDFIRAVGWIKHHLPYAKTSGGVSNLSFAFRGNNTVREAMHSAFLYHAVHEGLDMAIVNPAMLQVYDDIEPTLLKAVEDVILNRHQQATEQLIALASAIKERKEQDGTREEKTVATWRQQTVEERLSHALATGISEYLAEDIPEVLSQYGGDAVAVIEQPLMRAMERVGQLFAEGKMFLPQVVKSAKVMKEAVNLLTAADTSSAGSAAGNEAPVVVLATANGDVHDIGKNIVGIVLACNHFDVHDLGVMVSNETIVEATRRLHPCLVGVSGLITPSLREMENLCRDFQRAGLRVPLIVGGATTSAVHTAVKLAPLYDYCVAFGGDASYTSILAKRLLTDREATIASIKAEQQRVRDAYENRQTSVVTDYAEACRQAPVLTSPAGYADIETLHTYESLHPTLADLEPLVDWSMYLRFWGFRGENLQQQLVNPEAAKTLREGKEQLRRVVKEQTIEVSSLLRFSPAHREGNDIVLTDRCRWPMLRSQSAAAHYLSLADFFDTDRESPLGMFVVTARPIRKGEAGQVSSVGENETVSSVEKPADDNPIDEKLLSHALCARLAEAAATWLQQQALGGLRVIRPAFGYPVCPDHSLKRILFDQLDAERQLSISLNDHYSISPSTTVCGLLIAHPEARYFAVGRISREQLDDYCRRRGITTAKGQALLSKYLKD